MVIVIAYNTWQINRLYTGYKLLPSRCYIGAGYERDTSGIPAGYSAGNYQLTTLKDGRIG